MRARKILAFPMPSLRFSRGEMGAFSYSSPMGVSGIIGNVPYRIGSGFSLGLVSISFVVVPSFAASSASVFWDGTVLVLLLL